MNDKEKYERLKNAIRVFSVRTTVSNTEWLRLKDEQQFKDGVLRRSALRLGEKLLEDGLVEIKEWDSENESLFNGGHTFQLRVECLLQNAPIGHFTAQLNESRLLGIKEAASIVKEIASKLAALGDYGPIQAIALRGAADSILEKCLNSDRPGAT